MKNFPMRDAEARHVMGGERGYILRSAKPAVTVGDELRVQERLWISDCGKYYAMQNPNEGSSMYDVVTIDGQQWWFGGRYTDAHFPYHVWGWSNRGKRVRPSKQYPNGRFILAFEQNFSGPNASLSATFHKQIDARQMPEWAHRLTLRVTSIEHLPMTWPSDDRVRGSSELKSAAIAYGRDHETDLWPKEGLWMIGYERVSFTDHAFRIYPQAVQA